MNQLTKRAFEQIRSAAGNFRVSVTDTFTRYRKDVEAAKRKCAEYKDEDVRLEEMRGVLKSNARTAIETAITNYQSAVEQQISVLKKELQQHVSLRPNDAVLQTLRIWADFGIKPTKMEVESLIQQNCGCALGLKAINATLEKVKSEFRIECIMPETLETDIKSLENNASSQIRYAPLELYSELVDVYKGTPQLQKASDGTYYDNGMKWTSTGLLIATQAFSSTMNKIDEMIDRWESAVIPSNYNLVMYKGSEKTPAQQLEDDRAETDTGRIASNNSSVERAREMGKTTAEINERAAETIKYYTAS